MPQNRQIEHVVGPQKQLIAISIGPEDDMERRRADIIEAIHEADSGEGVVLLTDMFGGTPSNLAISVMNGGKVEVLAGINLPMLIKLASVRDAATLLEVIAGRDPLDATSASAPVPNYAAHLEGGVKGRKIGVISLAMGSVPITKALPYDWYDTPNIHQCTIKDFVRLCDRLGITIERSIALNHLGDTRRIHSSVFLANLVGEQGVFLLTRQKR